MSASLGLRLERLHRGVDARTPAAIQPITRRAVDHRITVRAGHHGEPGEQLVGAVPPELAFAALLASSAAAAPP